jgi:hypothetical protein
VPVQGHHPVEGAARGRKQQRFVTFDSEFICVFAVLGLSRILQIGRQKNNCLKDKLSKGYIKNILINKNKIILKFRKK